MPKSEGRLGPCIDVRGDGSYAMAPPSLHPDGPTYRWVNDAGVAAIAPDWLIALTRARPTISVRATQALANHRRLAASVTPDAYGQAALDGEIEVLIKAPQGTRNHALNQASFSLYQLVGGGELADGEVHTRLVDAATANGLWNDPNDGPRSVLRTIASGRRAGLLHPRNRGGAQ